MVYYDAGMNNSKLTPITVTAWMELKGVMKSDGIRKTSRAYSCLWKPTDLAVKSRMVSSKSRRMMWDIKRQGVADTGKKFSILWHSRASVADDSPAFLSV